MKCDFIKVSILHPHSDKLKISRFDFFTKLTALPAKPKLKLMYGLRILIRNQICIAYFSERQKTNVWFGLVTYLLIALFCGCCSNVVI